MVTDDERREVARRLRGISTWWSSGQCYYAIVYALGLPDTSREDGGHALYAALADLIDPGEAPTSSDTTPTHTDASATCDMSQSCRDTVACDREKLLRLADSVQYAGENVSAEHRYTVGVTLRNIADRIREALGVSDG